MSCAFNMDVGVAVLSLPHEEGAAFAQTHTQQCGEFLVLLLLPTFSPSYLFCLPSFSENLQRSQPLGPIDFILGWAVTPKNIWRTKNHKLWELEGASETSSPAQLFIPMSAEKAREHPSLP